MLGNKRGPDRSAGNKSIDGSQDKLQSSAETGVNHLPIHFAFVDRSLNPHGLAELVTVHSKGIHKIVVDNLTTLG